MRKGFLATVAVIVLAASAGVAAAQTGLPFGLIISEQSRPSFSIVGAGARPAGMGGAFTALADDAAAASFNPAGLALLLVPEVSLVGSYVQRTDSHSNFVTLSAGRPERYTDTSSSFDASSLNFAAVTMPFEVAERNLCIQLSYHRLIDFTYELDRAFTEYVQPDQPTALFQQVVEQSGDIHTFNVAVAYQLTQRLSVGAGLSRWEGDWTFDSFNARRGSVAAQDDYFAYHQANRLRGWDWNVGALLRYRYLNVGAMYRAGLDADYTFSSLLATNIDTPFESEPAVTRPLHWPTSWALGIAVKPTDTWHITADYARYNWSEMEIREFGTDRNISLNFFDLSPSGETATKDVGQWRFGTEVTFFAGHTLLAVRGGYFREPQPVRLSAGGDATTVDGYSLGFGLKRGRLAVDVAYQRRESDDKVAAFIDPRVIASGLLQRSAVGGLDVSEDRVFVAVIYQFSSREWLRKAFHFLFVAPSEEPAGDAT